MISTQARADAERARDDAADEAFWSDDATKAADASIKAATFLRHRGNLRRAAVAACARAYHATALAAALARRALLHWRAQADARRAKAIVAARLLGRCRLRSRAAHRAFARWRTWTEFAAKRQVFLRSATKLADRAHGASRRAGLTRGFRAVGARALRRRRDAKKRFALKFVSRNRRATRASLGRALATWRAADALYRALPTLLLGRLCRLGAPRRGEIPRRLSFCGRFRFFFQRQASTRSAPRATGGGASCGGAEAASRKGATFPNFLSRPFSTRFG